MSKGVLIAIISVFATCLSAQTNRIVVKATNESVEIKWYSNTLVFKEPVDLYRSENNGSWIKLNAQPFRMGAQQPTSTEFQNDKELRQFIDLLNGGKKLEGPALLITSLKSFKSAALCRYIGNYYEDKSVTNLHSYQYRIVKSGERPEQFLAESEIVKAGSPQSQLPIDSIYYTTGFRSVQVGWRPETMRYYGVNIYRSLSADSLGTLVNNDPILVSKVKDEQGVLSYPDYFFEDVKLKEKQTYYYTLVGLDFFGGEIQQASPIIVRIRDYTFPDAPVSIRKNVYGKRVDLHWYKVQKDEDFAGYAVYRAKFRAKDSLRYERINTELLAFEDSVLMSTVQDFGLYFFKVAAVDQEGNEAFSPELIADIIDNEPPLPPTNVKVISDTARLVVTWNPNAEPDILGYRIYRSVKNELKALTILTADIVRETQFIDSLPANARNQFTYAVLAVDTSLNESKLSEAGSNAMVDILPPKQPFLKQVTFSDGKNQIDWVKNTELDLAGYHLYRSTGDDTIMLRINTDLIPVDIARYLDRTVVAGKTYHYQLVAVDERNNVSLYSNKISIRLREKAEEVAHKVAISKVKFDKASASVKVSWKSDVQEGNYQYILFRRVGNTEFQMISKKGEGLNYRDTNVRPGDVVEYQVRMYDDAGRVTRSEITSFKVPQKRVKTN